MDRNDAITQFLHPEVVEAMGGPELAWNNLLAAAWRRTIQEGPWIWEQGPAERLEAAASFHAEYQASNDENQWTMQENCIEVAKVLNEALGHPLHPQPASATTQRATLVEYLTAHAKEKLDAAAWTIGIAAAHAFDFVLLTGWKGRRRLVKTLVNSGLSGPFVFHVRLKIWRNNHGRARVPKFYLWDITKEAIAAPWHHRKRRAEAEAYYSQFTPAERLAMLRPPPKVAAFLAEERDMARRVKESAKEPA